MAIRRPEWCVTAAAGTIDILRKLSLGPLELT